MKKLNFFVTLSLVMVSVWGFAQDVTITGNVSDDNSLALPGATVLVEGTSNGVTTDFDGNYSISASVGDVLVFSYVGFDSKSTTVGNSSKINVQLNSSNELEEVVVTGITSRDRKRLTSSSVVVSSELIEGIALSSPDQALQGRVAGLRVATTSGTPGAPQEIRIRGEGSISGSNSPLFVIDGVPVNNSTISPLLTDMGILSMINASDIESITVLKDASATAPYGARGSNGVIVITTKSGSAGEVTYNLSTQYGFQNYARDERAMLTGNQRLELGAETIINDFGWDKERATNYALANFAGAAAWDAGGRVDGRWEEMIKVKDAPYQSYDLSASGGSAQENFRMSVGFKNTVGTSVGTDFESVSGSFTYKRKAGRVDIVTSNRVTNSIQNGIHEGGSYFGAPQANRLFMSPFQQPKNPDGTWNINLSTSVFNTLYLAEMNIQQNDGTRAISNTTVTYRINDDLKFRTRYALDFTLGVSHEYRNPHHGDAKGTNGYSYQNTSRSFTWSTNNSLEFDKTVDDVHFISAVAQMEFQKNKYTYNSSSGQNVPADGLYYVNSFGTNESASGAFSDWKQLSYLALLNYSYMDKYVADFSFKNEGSSRFAKGFRFGNFWSAGIAWNISNENFLDGSKIVNNLKLRASIGETGSNSVGLNQYQSLFGYSASYDDNGAVYPSSFGNLLLSWEKQQLYDIGLDFSLLDNRVSGSIGYYNRNTNDLLQSVPLSTTSGHSSQTQNVGEVENKGIEIELSSDVLKLGEFTWNIYANYATNDNKVLKLAKDADGNDINLDGGYNRTRVGEPMGVWYIRGWAGVNSDTGNPMYYKGGATDPSMEIVNSYGAASQMVQGDRIPTYSGGLGTRLSFKNFYLDGNLYFAGGHKVFERWNWYTHSTNLLSTRYYQGAAKLMERWQKPGDVTGVPRMRWSTSTSGTGSGTTSRFLHDGDFVRLRDVVMGYSLPKATANRLGFDNVGFSVRGLNLFTWVKDPDLGVDPEIRNSGSWEIYTPPLKSISVGLNLKF
ncbi:MAG: SusC/RagA family TonB-linked outer membrane protein [Flavobacteriales bacterium]